ncbi:hypothetical protein CCR75_005510 [Bremia lactucae]|uniref:Uncharacterized protein n=1 Tax=Bremia lactucae TaxID=4779 RepID=A0A976NZL8_BRELC|nr:hypothetical protein CCR75_005510 [Bremia lactucae]
MAILGGPSGRRFTTFELALVEQSGDSGHTSLVIRHQSTTLVTQRDLESEWPRTALSGFPTVGSNNIDWNKVAQTEPRRLPTMVRRFPHKSQLLQVLSDETLVAWSAVWRQECMYDRLAVYQDRVSDHVT